MDTASKTVLVIGAIALIGILVAGLVAARNKLEAERERDGAA